MGKTAGIVAESLTAVTTAAGARPIAVIHQPRLGRALAERGYDIVQILERDKGRARAGERRVLAQPEALPLEDGELSAVVGLDLGLRDDWEALLGEWTRVVGDGGVLVMLDRAPLIELTRRALCGGLTEIEQRRAGRKVITSGRVTRL